MVRACGQTQDDGEGQDQQPEGAAGRHWAKGGRAASGVQGLTAASPPELRRSGPLVGSMNQKLEPRDGIDSAPMIPPCISTNFFDSARPRPVPCAWRLAELSTWLNSWNSFAMSVGAMPIPESATAIHTTSC